MVEILDRLARYHVREEANDCGEWTAHAQCQYLSVTVTEHPNGTYEVAAFLDMSDGPVAYDRQTFTSAGHAARFAVSHLES